MEKLLEFMTRYQTAVRSIVIVVLMFAALWLYSGFRKRSRNTKLQDGGDVDRGVAVFNSSQENSVKRLQGFGFMAIIVIGVLLVLYVNGINVTAGLAGVGIVSTIVGLAMQDYLKDTIMGLRIISDSFYEIGDVIRINGITGAVIDLTLQYTKIESTDDHSVYSIRNGEITSVERLSHLLDISIPFPYEISHERAKKAVEKICGRVWMIEGMENCYYKGVAEFAGSSVVYKLRCFIVPERHPEVKYKAQAITRQVFGELGIEIPFEQLDVRMKSV